VYGIHNNHDHIDEGERVKEDRRGVEEWKKVGENEGRQEIKEKRGRRLPHVLPLIDGV
jgi:hypothetical protein